MRNSPNPYKIWTLWVNNEAFQNKDKKTNITAEFIYKLAVKNVSYKISEQNNKPNHWGNTH